MSKMHIIIAKRVSKNGNTYITAGVKIGKYAKRDYYFPNINSVEAATGMSLTEIENADVGVLLDKEVEL